MIVSELITMLSLMGASREVIVSIPWAGYDYDIEKVDLVGETVVIEIDGERSSIEDHLIP